MNEKNHKKYNNNDNRNKLKNTKGKTISLAPQSQMTHTSLALDNN